MDSKQKTTQKLHDIEIDQEEKIKKFHELEVDHEYTVIKHSEVYNTSFGEQYTLKIFDNTNSDDIISVYATKSLVNYIRNEKPKKKFNFTVRILKRGKFTGKSYADIEGYKPYEQKFVVLK